MGGEVQGELPLPVSGASPLGMSHELLAGLLACVLSFLTGAWSIYLLTHRVLCPQFYLFPDPVCPPAAWGY